VVYNNGNQPSQAGGMPQINLNQMDSFAHLNKVNSLFPTINTLPDVKINVQPQPDIKINVPVPQQVNKVPQRIPS